MSRRFKLRLSRAIHCFHSCRSSNGTSSLPANPDPSNSRHGRHSSSLGLHVSSAITSVGCCLCSKPPRRQFSDDDDEFSEIKWRKEGTWHVADTTATTTPNRKSPKMYNTSVSATSDEDVIPPPPQPKAGKKKMKKKKTKRSKKNRRKVAARMLRLSTSSADDSGFYFSSEGGGGGGGGGTDDDHNNNNNNDIFYEEEKEEETEALVSSSRSFSTDSSSSDLSTTRKKKKKKKKKDSEEEARLSVFKRLIPCGVEGKVRESFAVVKRSEEPYEDFKRSMLEMIVENNMFEPRDLEQLLHCFLSLNTHHHHALIVRAFSEIWESLFSQS